MACCCVPRDRLSAGGQDRDPTGWVDLGSGVWFTIRPVGHPLRLALVRARALNQANTIPETAESRIPPLEMSETLLFCSKLGKECPVKFVLFCWPKVRLGLG